MIELVGLLSARLKPAVIGRPSPSKEFSYENRETVEIGCRQCDLPNRSECRPTRPTTQLVPVSLHGLNLHRCC